MDIIKPPKKNIILDATLFNALMGCAQFMDFRYNHSLQSLKGKSNSLETGSIAHIILEKYYKSLQLGLSREQAIGYGMTAGQLYIDGCPHCSDPDNQTPQCKHQPLEYPGVRNTPMNNEKSRIGWKWVLDTCEQYFDFYKADSWTTIEVEVVKGEILYEDDEIRILWKAKLDWVVDTNQGLYPVDHKTMKARREKTTLNVQFLGQCLLMKTRSVIKNNIGFQTSLKPEEKFTREMINFSPARLLEFQSEILPYYAYKYLGYMEAGYYPPNYTHCENNFGMCMFKNVCESDRGMREEALRVNFFKGPMWNPSNAVEVEE